MSSACERRRLRRRRPKAELINAATPSSLGSSPQRAASIVRRAGLAGGERRRLPVPCETLRVLRWLTAGESHGPALVAMLDGVPAGVEVTSEEIGRDLARRRLGYGRGARMAFEQDVLEIVGGLRHGRTLGSPVAIRIGNSEWPKWETVMAADPVDPAQLAAQARNAPLTRPRPGHADLAGMQKYGHTDARPILERASARETAARVAVGTVAKALLHQALGVRIVSHVVELGSVAVKPGVVPLPDDLARVDADPMRCADPQASARMVE